MPDTPTTPLAIPAIVAHRGYAGRYPENTLTAITAALRTGVHHIEVDVQISADGMPVLCHDDSLRRTTGHSGRVTGTPWPELATFGAGEPARFGDRFRDTRIPSLAQLMALQNDWPEALFFIEIKQESLDAFGMRAVELMMAAMETQRARCIVISFNAEAVAEARRLGARIGWVLSAWTPEQQVQADALAPEYLFCNYRKLPGAAAPLWSGPWQWACYEVTDPRLALRLAQRGVTLIESMTLEAYTGAPWNLTIDDED